VLQEGEALMTVETLTQIGHQREMEINSLRLALEDREEEKMAHQEELTELRRLVNSWQWISLHKRIWQLVEEENSV